MTYADLEREYGSPTNIAKALGVSSQLVTYWRRKGIPKPRQALIQLKTRGRLRADISEPQPEQA